MCRSWQSRDQKNVWARNEEGRKEGIGFYVAFISRRDRNPEPGRISLLFTNSSKSFSGDSNLRTHAWKPGVVTTKPTRIPLGTRRCWHRAYGYPQHHEPSYTKKLAGSNYCLNPFTLRAPSEPNVCYFHTFENNLRTERKFIKYFKESCSLASDKHFSFICFPENAFESNIFPNLSGLFLLL